MGIFDFAIQMENDGEQYYREQAEKNAGNALEKVFLLLAEDEKHHAEILKGQSEGKSFEPAESQTLGRVKNIFAGIGDFKSEITPLPSQLDAYETALQMEKKSINLYEDFLAQSADESAGEIFTYLIGQEKEHYSIIEDVVEMLRNAISWVESAEFGIRKEY